MDPIKKNDSGAAVEDVQRRLVKAGYLAEDQVTGTLVPKRKTLFCRCAAIAALNRVLKWTTPFGPNWLTRRSNWATATCSCAFRSSTVPMFVRSRKLFPRWAFLVVLPTVFFGVHTEDALRRFQLNMGLPTDGIAGAFTHRALLHLQHSWKGKDSFSPVPRLGFARAAQVLESNLICLFGTSEFTRSVAARMSNLALATTPASKVTSADSLLVAPDESMYFVQILVGNEKPASTVPTVDFVDEESLPDRVGQALMATEGHQRRIAVRLPEEGWEDAGADRSAQHYAIVLLDALCSGLVIAEQR